MNKKEWMKSFILATGLLPERLWRGVYTLSEEERVRLEEVRIRLGRPLCLVLDGGVQIPMGPEGPLIVNREEIDEVMARATESSIHAYNDQLRNGFITLKGGHRLGVCGEAAGDGGEMRTVRNFSSLNLRIAKAYTGVAAQVLDRVRGRDGVQNTLVLSPPGGGKTTLLRDMARLLSQEYLLSIVDERMEIAACLGGAPQFDVGNADVLSRVKKARAIEQLTRAMSPQIIVVDEITGVQDVEAMAQASYTGCTFLASAHGSSLDDLYARPVYRELMRLGIFRKAILIRQSGGSRSYEVVEIGGENDVQADWRDYDCRLMRGNGRFGESLSS